MGAEFFCSILCKMNSLVCNEKPRVISLVQETGTGLPSQYLITYKTGDFYLHFILLEIDRLILKIKRVIIQLFSKSY